MLLYNHSKGDDKNKKLPRTARKVITMKKMFVYDFENQAVVSYKSTIARANKGINPEYSVLTSMLKAQPTFSVKAKVIDVNKNKKSHNGLTLERMAEYIKTQPNSEKALEKFEAVKKIAKAKGACYPFGETEAIL